MLIFAVLTGQALCDMGQCLNGGTCMPGLDNFNCTCPLGYFGRFCDVFIDICDLNDCYNNGTCVDSPQGFTCFCSEDFTGMYRTKVTVNDVFIWVQIRDDPRKESLLKDRYVTSSV